MPKNAKPNRKKNPAPKHFAQLDPTRRAMADQVTRDALLAIVVAQGKVVRIPLIDLDEITELHRLMVTIDRKGGYVELQAEKHKLIEIEQPGKLLILDESPAPMDPARFEAFKPN